MKKEKEVEFIDPKEENQEDKKIFSFQEVIDGTFLTRQVMAKQLPYILFISFLASIYIGNRFHAEKVIRDTTKLQDEVRDLRAQSITSASELMFISKQSEVVKLVKENQLDLIESVQPPFKIKE